MSCCNPCNTTVTYENRKAAAKADSECQKKLEAALKELEELKAKQAEAEKHPCCPAFKVESITKAGSEVLITFDNCTFVKAPMSVVDAALAQGKTEDDRNTVDALKQALEELKTKVTALEGKEDKDTVYDDSALVKRIEALETKEDKDTVFDPTSIEERLTALEGKEDKDTIFDPTSLENRITAIENKEDKDTVFDPSGLDARIKALEEKATNTNPESTAPAVDTSAFVRKDELIEVANFAGTVRFKAYPADVATGATNSGVHLDMGSDHL